MTISVTSLKIIPAYAKSFSKTNAHTLFTGKFSFSAVCFSHSRFDVYTARIYRKLQKIYSKRILRDTFLTKCKNFKNIEIQFCELSLERPNYFSLLKLIRQAFVDPGANRPDNTARR